MAKNFNITSVCKDDIISLYEETDKKTIKLIEKMSNEDMGLLARKMADDYCNQLFWSSLQIIFEEYFKDKGEF